MLGAPKKRSRMTRLLKPHCQGSEKRNFNSMPSAAAKEETEKIGETQQRARAAAVALFSIALSPAHPRTPTDRTS